jgi:hypothetical protein
MKFAKFRPWLLEFAFVAFCAVPQLVAERPAPQPRSTGNAAGFQIRLPNPTKVIVKYPDGSEIKLSLEEQVAFVFLASTELLEYSCSDPKYIGRVWSLDELIKGIRAKNGAMLGFSQNPKLDPHYHYTLTMSDSGDRYQIEAIPQRAGLGGFVCLGKKGWMFGDRFYNPKGAAANTSSKLGNTSIARPDFRLVQ